MRVQILRAFFIGAGSMKIRAALAAVLMLGAALSLTACQNDRQDAMSAQMMPPPPPPPPPAPAMAAAPNGYWQPANTSKFPQAKPNAVKIVAEEPVSTFSIDVDTASYGVMRNYLNRGDMPPADAIRVEEMVNYFDYAYSAPQSRAVPFRASQAVYPAPWNAQTQILHIGIKGFELPKAARPPVNLVFLIDTSGSMGEPNKLPLLKRAFRLLADQLGGKDRVAIVTYSGTVGVALEPTSGADKAKIVAALDKLEASGATAGGQGLRTAYELAEAGLMKGGVNRVIMATDGDFNVGITDPSQLESYVVGERDKGVELSCIGFGSDNYSDALMQKLSQSGNGNAYFIDSYNEARKVFSQQITGTLVTIAKDVKIQVEFNPDRIAEYRLIGYETRLLNRTDFNNDKVDAGDIGAGHTVTALYELTPVDSKARMSDPLRYAHKAKAKGGAKNEIAFIKIRYKLPGETKSHLITRPVTDANVVSGFGRLPDDMRFAAAVAGAGQLMRHDPYIKDFSYAKAIEIAQASKGVDTYGYRSEFVQLLRSAQAGSGME